MSLKLKILRTQANLTLEELAVAAGLTRGYVSKIERGLSKPSIGVALKLARALHIPVDELFGDSGERDPVTITRAAVAKANFDLRGSPRVVAGTSPGHRMLAVVLKPGEVEGTAHPMSHHEGDELLYVLKGSIILQLADRRELLDVGDCAYFNSAIPHKLIQVGDKEAEALVIIALDQPE